MEPFVKFSEAQGALRLPSYGILATQLQCRSCGYKVFFDYIFFAFLNFFCFLWFEHFCIIFQHIDHEKFAIISLSLVNYRSNFAVVRINLKYFVMQDAFSCFFLHFDAFMPFLALSYNKLKVVFVNIFLEKLWEIFRVKIVQKFACGCIAGTSSSFMKKEGIGEVILQLQSKKDETFSNLLFSFSIFYIFLF